MKEPKKRVAAAFMSAGCLFIVAALAAIPVACYIAFLGVCTDLIVSAEYGPGIELEGKQGEYRSIQVDRARTKDVTIVLPGGKVVLLSDLTQEMMVDLDNTTPFRHALFIFDPNGKLEEATLLDPTVGFSVRGSEYLYLPITINEAERVLGKPTSKGSRRRQQSWSVH